MMETKENKFLIYSIMLTSNLIVSLISAYLISGTKLSEIADSGIVWFLIIFVAITIGGFGCVGIHLSTQQSEEEK